MSAPRFYVLPSHADGVRDGHMVLDRLDCHRVKHRAITRDEADAFARFLNDDPAWTFTPEPPDGPRRTFNHRQARELGTLGVTVSTIARMLGTTTRSLTGNPAWRRER